MDGKIKSALEKALERAASFKEVSGEEIDRMEYMPRGRTIAASFMFNKSFDLKEALDQVAAETREYVLEGMQEVFLLNIALSVDETADEATRRAMEGIMLIKRDKSQATRILGELDQLMGYYRQALEQTRERFKQELEMRGKMSRRQGARGREQDRMMEFREEWASVVRQLNERFEAGLAEIKERIRSIS
ncbi:MAG: hypothetical protein ACOY4I_07580 [Bacillota bacterium]